MSERIIFKGICTNNLKNIDVELKKNAINLILGVSGSGKSSLAYDTIAELGRYEMAILGGGEVHEPTYSISSFQNVPPSVSIRQLNHNNNVRSTIGTYFGLSRVLTLLFASRFSIGEERFTLNRAENVCPHCMGIGVNSLLSESLIVDYRKPLISVPFRCWNIHKDFYAQIIEHYCAAVKIDPQLSLCNLSEEKQKLILWGESEEKYTIKYKKTNRIASRTSRYYGPMTGRPMLADFKIGKKFYSEVECSACRGRKYSDELSQYKVEGLSIGDFSTTAFVELLPVVKRLAAANKNALITFSLERLIRFLAKSIELNLGYLNLNRSIPSLSGGELQRLKMVQLLNSQLSDLLVVLDEPLAGLSGDERNAVIDNVRDLSDRHTIVVVEHGNSFVPYARQIIALGPRSGKNGGYLIDLKKFLEAENQPIRHKPQAVDLTIDVHSRQQVRDYFGASMKIAKNRLNLVRGKSGIGKSTLIRDYLPQCIDNYTYISQKPLLGNKNSTVASSLDMFTRITTIFAKKYCKERTFFSNLTGDAGACVECGGAGYVEYGYDERLKSRLVCKSCRGTGFSEIVNQYEIEGKSIADVCKLPLEDAAQYFEKIDKRVSLVCAQAVELHLGHLILGQPTRTLSGGENVRIKVLKNAYTSASIVGIDEPFKGLNHTEIIKMVYFLESLTAKGKTIIVADHSEYAPQFFSMINELSVKEHTIMGKVVEN